MRAVPMLVLTPKGQGLTAINPAADSEYAAADEDSAAISF
jgi:hypothetical protein